MRFTNPDGTLRLRSATLRAVPSRSRFGRRRDWRLIYQTIPYSLEKQANPAKTRNLKILGACKSFSFLVSVPASSLRRKRGFPTLLRCGGEVSQRAFLAGDEWRFSELRHK